MIIYFKKQISTRSKILCNIKATLLGAFILIGSL